MKHSLWILVLVIVLVGNYLFATPTGSESDQKFHFNGELTLLSGFMLGLEEDISEKPFVGIDDYERIVGTMGLGVGTNFVFPLEFGFARSTFSKIVVTLRSNLMVMGVSNMLSATFSPFPFYSLSIGFNINTFWPGALSIAAFDQKLVSRSRMYDYSLIFDFFVKNSLTFILAMVVPEKYKRWTRLFFKGNLLFSYREFFVSHEGGELARADHMNGRFNGWQIGSSFIVGYQIPIIENADKTQKSSRQFSINPGFIMRIEDFSLSHCLDSPISNGGWGSDFVYDNFGPMFGVDLPYNFSVDIMGLFKNEKLYDDNFYQTDLADKQYKDWYLYFHMVNISFSWNF